MREVARVALPANRNAEVAAMTDIPPLKLVILITHGANSDKASAGFAIDLPASTRPSSPRLARAIGVGRHPRCGR